MTIVTVAERRAKKTAFLAAAADAVRHELTDYPRKAGVRFTVFGSFARGDIVSTSDLDLLIEGPEDRLRPARDAAEASCERHGILADVHLATEASPGLMMRVRRDGQTLS